MCVYVINMKRKALFTFNMKIFILEHTRWFMHSADADRSAVSNQKVILSKQR